MQCFRSSLSDNPFVCLFVCLLFQCIGKVGKISKIDGDGDVHISYGLQSWVFHPDAVTKVCMYVCGIVLNGGIYG